MPRMKVQQEAMLRIDEIKMCGQGAKEDFKRLCRERGVDENSLFFSSDYTQVHLDISNEVWALWHTTKKFKVGDKVYVVPLTHTTIPNCIRATVTEVGDPRWGYHLRAFESDLPGIYMFNMWDKDLEPRTSKANKPTPPELLIK